MKFKMNNRTWEIIEETQEKIKKIDKETDEKITIFGLTCYDTQKIYLWKDLCLEAKIQTLKHELAHCYIGSYCSFSSLNLNEEVVCNIFSNSHDIITKIIKKYEKVITDETN